MADVEGLKQQLRDQMAQTFIDATDLLRQAAADNAPHSTLESTGALAAGVQVDGVTVGDQMTARIVSTARSFDGVDYGEIQETGTGPIYPVRAKVLHFVWNGVEIWTQRTAGVPRTNWWSESVTQANWSDAVQAARP